MIVAKQTMLFISGDRRFKVANNQIVVDVPEWVTKTRLYQNAVRDRKIIESNSKKDKDIDTALKTKTIAQEKQLAEEIKEMQEEKTTKKKGK